MVRATAGACRILVVKASPDGSDRDQIRRQATAADTVFVVFGGRIYAEQPTWLTSIRCSVVQVPARAWVQGSTTPVLCCHSDEELWG